MHTGEMKWGRRASSSQTHGLFFQVTLLTFCSLLAHGRKCASNHSFRRFQPLSSSNFKVSVCCQSILSKNCAWFASLPTTRLETSNNCNIETKEGKKLCIFPVYFISWSSKLWLRFSEEFHRLLVVSQIGSVSSFFPQPEEDKILFFLWKKTLKEGKKCYLSTCQRLLKEHMLFNTFITALWKEHLQISRKEDGSLQTSWNRDTSTKQWLQCNGTKKICQYPSVF